MEKDYIETIRSVVKLHEKNYFYEKYRSYQRITQQNCEELIELCFYRETDHYRRYVELPLKLLTDNFMDFTKPTQIELDCFRLVYGVDWVFDAVESE